MKLATYQDGSRDGQLVLVSRDLRQAHYATHIANRLQQVLDDWNYLAPALQDTYTQLNQGRARHAFPFDPAQCMAPLPRAYQCLGSVAYVNHLDLMHQALGSEMPESARNTPWMHQDASDDLGAPHANIACASEAWGMDFGAALAVITGDVPMGCAPDRALDAVRLLALVNQVTPRKLVSDALPAQFGFVHSKPSPAFAPVVVTPDELGEAWTRGRAHLPVQSIWNGRKVGLCEAGNDMHFHFGQLIAHAAQTRRLRAGSIISSGVVSNKGVARKNRTDWPAGYSCIAEKRAMETLQDGQPSTEYMKFGDSIHIEAKGRDGMSIFGAIQQEVVPLGTSPHAIPPPW